MFSSQNKTLGKLSTVERQQKNATRASAKKAAFKKGNFIKFPCTVWANLPKWILLGHPILKEFKPCHHALMIVNMSERRELIKSANIVVITGHNNFPMPCITSLIIVAITFKMMLMLKASSKWAD